MQWRKQNMLFSFDHGTLGQIRAAERRLKIGPEISSDHGRLSWKSLLIPVNPPADCNNSTNLDLNPTMD